MIDVTVENFEAEVIAASSQIPVLLDFWAPWCGPCKSLGPVLEKLELDYAGRFKLVKINSDDEQQLSQAFGIRSIPTCVLMMDGKPVDGFMGALPEGKLREFLDKHLPGKDELLAEEDLNAAEELLADAKERAEHIMLVDLGRNDAGRVAQTGSVRVTEQMVIERYSHVMHIVSNVEARLKPGLTAIDVLRATFPAGTVSGAPKVRAMEIIDELEPVKRCIYAGAVGYLGFHGNMDVAIALRTAVVKDGRLHVQAGGGVVADSQPEAEWQETQNKARALLRAAEMAEAGLDTRLD